MKKKDFIINIIYAFSAQIISLILSLIMSLVIPKILGKDQFAYWQLFLFYSSYVGFLSFGFNDGLYLKHGGSSYDTLDDTLIGSQIKINIVIQSFMALAFATIIFFFIDDVYRVEIIVATCIFAILNNLNAYLGYLLQAVNQTKKFSVSTMIEKFSFLVIVVVLLICSIKEYHLIIWFYIFAKFLSLIYLVYHSKKIILSKLVINKKIFIEMIDNMRIGIKLMLANIASMLILGVGRFFIDSVWGLTVFGEFSFSLSMCTFFLSFVTQVSMVLFPALRQTTEEGIIKFYKNCRVFLGVGLPLIFLLYLPLKAFIGLWLPDYKSSLHILGFLLPLCTYDGKMNMLCNTYFKVLRKEKILLFVNIIAFCVSFLLSFIGAYLICNINFIVFGMVFSIAIRSIISELILAKIMKASIKLDLVIESILVIGYIVSIILFDDVFSLIIYAFLYLCFITFKRKEIIQVIKQLRS